MNKKVGGKKALNNLEIVSHPQNNNAGSARNGKARPCNPGHKPKDSTAAVPGK